MVVDWFVTRAGWAGPHFVVQVGLSIVVFFQPLPLEGAPAGFSKALHSSIQNFCAEGTEGSNHLEKSY